VTLHHDLLEQAFHLARREIKKPKQASLRRAVSAAYYALFHLLIAQGAKRLSPPNPDGLRRLVQRSFNHGEMRNICKGFAEGHKAAIKGKAPGQPPAATRKLISLPLDTRLFSVTQAFVERQEARSLADYDLEKYWKRIEVLEYIETSRQAFTDWASIRNTPAAAVFVAALLLQKQWAR
jgi:hypothetical protein